MKHLLKIIYACTLIPFFFFVGEFLWWYYRTTRYPTPYDPSLTITPGLVILTICALLLLVSLILCVVFVIKRRTEWKKLIGPLSVFAGCFVFLEITEDVHRYFHSMVFVRIINDTDKRIDRIWSANFERTYNENEDGKDFIVRYPPVYTWTWNIPPSSESMAPDDTFSVNPVYIDIVEGPDSVSTYRFLHLKEGERETVKLSDILAGKIKIRDRMWVYW